MRVCARVRALPYKRTRDQASVCLCAKHVPEAHASIPAHARTLTVPSVSAQIVPRKLVYPHTRAQIMLPKALSTHISAHAHTPTAPRIMAAEPEVLLLEEEEPLDPILETFDIDLSFL